jgi:hypothetical protein
MKRNSRELALPQHPAAKVVVIVLQTQSFATASSRRLDAGCGCRTTCPETVSRKHKGLLRHWRNIIGAVLVRRKGKRERKKGFKGMGRLRERFLPGKGLKGQKGWKLAALPGEVWHHRDGLHMSTLFRSLNVRVDYCTATNQATSGGGSPCNPLIGA